MQCPLSELCSFALSGLYSNNRQNLPILPRTQNFSPPIASDSSQNNEKRDLYWLPVRIHAHRDNDRPQKLIGLFFPGTATLTMQLKLFLN